MKKHSFLTLLLISWSLSLFSQSSSCTIPSTLNTPAPICLGQSATLNVTGTPSNVTYRWSANAGSATTSSVSVNPSATTTYTVTITQPAGSNQVVNGSFESDNSGFTTDYTYQPCGNNQTFIWNGQYGIGWSYYQCYAFWGTLAAQNGSRFMYVDGYPPAITGTYPARTRIWEQTVSVQPNTCYTFSSWQRFAINQFGQDRIPKVEYVVNGVNIGQSQYVTNNWVQTVYSSITGPTQTSLNLKIYIICELNGAGSITNGNDIAIDNIEFKIPTITTVKSVKVTVKPLPSVIAPTNQTVCSGVTTMAIPFSGSAVSGTTYNWTNNTTSIGLAGSGTSNIAAFIATNATSSPVTATISVTPTANGCTGTAQPFTITVNPTAYAGTNDSTSVCDNSTTPIDLFSLITGEQSGGVWTRTTGTGGTFNSGTGTFTPASGTTNSTFTYTITGTASCPNSSSVATVNLSPAIISSVTLQAGSATACTGAILTLNSNITNLTQDCTIQWQSGDGTNWEDISGANGTTFQTPPLTQDIQYRVRISCSSNPCASFFCPNDGP